MSNFGRDTSCTTSLRTGRFATGPRLVAEAAYRRLTTPRGTLRGGEEEANFGIDLMERIGSVSAKSDAASLPGEIKSELKKDERIDTMTVTVLQTKDGPDVSFDITIDAQTAEGPFTLQVAASALSIELLGIKAEG